MQASPVFRAASSSPTRFNEEDTIEGIFIGPLCDLESEEANLCRLQHALRDAQHESCAPSMDQSSTPRDVLDQRCSDSEDTLSPSKSDEFTLLSSPMRTLRPRKRVTLSPTKTRRRSKTTGRANRSSLPNASTSWTSTSETDSSTSNFSTTVTPNTRRRTRASTAAALASQTIPIPDDDIVTHQPLPPPGPASTDGQVSIMEHEDERPTTELSPARKARHSRPASCRNSPTLPMEDEPTSTRAAGFPSTVGPESLSLIRPPCEGSDEVCATPLDSEACLPNPSVIENRFPPPDRASESEGAAVNNANIAQSPSIRRSPRRHRATRSPSRHWDISSPPSEERIKPSALQAHANSDSVTIPDISCAVIENGIDIVEEGPKADDSLLKLPAASLLHVNDSVNGNEDTVASVVPSSPTKPPQEDDTLSVSTINEPLAATQAAEAATTDAGCADDSASVSSLVSPSIPDDTSPCVVTSSSPIRSNVGAEPRKASDTSTARTVSSSTSASEVRGILSGRVRQPMTPSRGRISPSKPVFSPRKNPLLASVSPKKSSAPGNVGKPAAPPLDPRFRFNPFLPSTPMRRTPAKAPSSIGPPVLISIKKPIQNVVSSGSGQSPVRPKPIPFTLTRLSPGKTPISSQKAGLGPGIGSVNRKRAREADEAELALVETPRRRPIPPFLSSASVPQITPPSRKRVRENVDDTDVLGSPAAETPTPSPNKRARPMPAFGLSSPDHDGDGDDTDCLAIKLRQMKEDVASWDNESKGRLKPARHSKFLESLKPSPALNFRNTRPATASGAATSNPRLLHPPSKPPAPSPHRRAVPSALTRPKLDTAKSTLAVFVSPSKTSRPVVPSPSRPGFGGTRTSPGKLPGVFSSPVRRPIMAGPSVSAVSAPHRASSNENMFQTGPVLPSSVQRASSSRIVGGTNSQPQQSRPVVAGKAGHPATTTPGVIRATGIPLPRGLTGVSNRPISRLPRPTASLVKPLATATSNPFTFGAGEAAAFAPMNINVSMAHVPGGEDVPSLKDNALPLEMTDKLASRAPPLSSSEPKQLHHHANPSSSPGHVLLSQGSSDMGSSPAISEASSLDPLGMSPIPKRPRRASRSGPSRLSLASNAERSHLPMTQPKRKSKGAAGERSPVSEMTAAALGKLTNNNTKRNEMRVAELDRRFVLLDIPRPPSPSSRIRTIAQKETDGAEMARQRRARNRSIMKGEILPLEEPANNVQPPLKHPRAPGDDGEYHTPKKTRLAIGMAERQKDGSEDRISDSVPILGEVEEERRRGEKFVRWDKLLATEGPSQSQETSCSEGAESSDGRTLRSALAKKAFYELDRHGNMAAAYQPMEGLKKDRVVVTKMIYADDSNDDPQVREARAVTLKGGIPVPSNSK